MDSKLTKGFLVRFLPVALLILLAGWLYEHSEDERLLNRAKNQEVLSVSQGAATVQRHIQMIVGDLAFIAEHYALQKLVNDPASPEIFRLERNLQSLVKTRQVYGQIRWLDAKGQEKVRVDLIDGKPSLIPQEQLQNKADRYYFADAMLKNDREVYISPLDLNIEQGKIESPFKPMLRLAMPVADQHGIKQGILIVNYLAELMIHGFDADVSLLNSDGYWLHSPNADDAWGFMFNDASRSMPSRSPATWAKLQGDSGQFMDAEGMWTYERVYPLGFDGNYHWLVLSHLNPSKLAAATAHSELNHRLFAALLLLLLGVGIFKLQRSKAQEQALENRFGVVFDYATVGIATTSPGKQFMTVNPALCRIFGYEAEALKQKSWAELSHPDDLSTDRKEFEAVLRGESDGYSMEKQYVRKDGSVIHAFVSARAVRTSDGTVDYFVVIVEDITERQRTQQKLAQQNRRSAVLLDLPVTAEQMTEQAFMKYALERAEELTDSVIGFMHFVNEDEASIELVAWSSSTLEKYCTAAFDCHYPITEAGIWADAAREKRPVVINDYATAPNKHGLPAGHSQLIRLLSIPVMEGGKVRMVTGVGNKASHYSDYDVESVQLIGNETWRIVQRNRSEQSLKIATQVVNASPAVCFRWAVIDGWPVVFVSENITQWGYSVEDIIAGRPPFSDLVHPDDLQRVGEVVASKTAAGVVTYDQEYRLLTQKNEVIWVVDRTNVHRDENGQPDYYDGVLTDITERKRQEAKLTETLAQQQILNKRLEEANNQLLQSEKMASIGQLAAGVAHELNNPIGFVHSNLGTLDGYLHDLMSIITAYEHEAEQTGKTVEAVRRIMEECDFDYLKDDIFSLLSESKDGLGRVRKIVQDLKSFSRVGEQEWQEADLHQGLDSTLNIVWNELKYKCKVVKEYGDLPPVHCMISQLNQVFMNLLVNAGHAIENQGTITIRTRRQGTDQVCVEVSDTGKGIAPEHITRIFEPFFTTKPVGKGTGLGLSLSYSIVQRHGGRIEVDSQVGVGSNFRLLLPIHPPAEHKIQDSEISS